MDVKVEQADCTEFETPLLAVKIFHNESDLVGPVAKLDERMGGAISEVIARGDFAGRVGQTAVLYPPAKAVGAERVLLVGLGKREGADLETLRRGAGTVVKEAMKLRVSAVASLLHHAELITEAITPESAGRAVAEGAVLGAYTFREMKSGPAESEPAPVELQAFIVLEKKKEKAREIEEGARIGSIIATAENRARTLGNLPGNVATPEHLAETARSIAEKTGMKCTILGRKELEKEGMRTLLAVSRGSEQEPRLIVLEHRGGKKDEKPLILLGKGLTFDAGGISIKPANGMEDMKFDMSGGAAVLGAMQGIGELDVKANVIGIVPSSENLLSGAAMKPGDVIRSHLGKTIEVINTDAEGRLILADALSYLRRFEPAAVVDAATLTGACVVALGHQYTGVLGNDDSLVEEVRAAGERSGEHVWQLPMPDEYKELLKSDYADIKNSGGRAAGTITAAWFLREFVGDFPWAHLDVAGTAYGDGKLSYQIKGSTGVPTRIFIEWVLSRARK